MTKAKFEVLGGLPATGPRAIPLPLGFSGVSEGYVVKFLPAFRQEWIGNFRCGRTDCFAVHHHPDGKRVVVVAGGADYLVDPETRVVEGHAADNICFSAEVKSPEMLVFGDRFHFWAEDRAGRKWSTPRIAWDGIRVTTVSAASLVGLAWSAFDESWHRFQLDLASGEVSGAVYEADREHFIPVKRKPLRPTPA